MTTRAPAVLINDKIKPVGHSEHIAWALGHFHPPGRHPGKRLIHSGTFFLVKIRMSSDVIQSTIHLQLNSNDLVLVMIMMMIENLGQE